MNQSKTFAEKMVEASPGVARALIEAWYGPVSDHMWEKTLINAGLIKEEGQQ